MFYSEDWSPWKCQEGLPGMCAKNAKIGQKKKKRKEEKKNILRWLYGINNIRCLEKNNIFNYQLEDKFAVNIWQTEWKYQGCFKVNKWLVLPKVFCITIRIWKYQECLAVNTCLKTLRILGSIYMTESTKNVFAVIKLLKLPGKLCS